MATGKDARAIKRMSLLVEVASVSLYLTGGGEKMRLRRGAPRPTQARVSHVFGCLHHVRAFFATLSASPTSRALSTSTSP